MLRKSILAGLAGVAIAFAAVPAQAREWVQIGEQTVERRADRDVLYVGSHEGRYSALRFSVANNDVAFAEVRVVYGNGTSEVLNVKEHVRAGETTRPYDLEGRRRVIEKIEFLYQTEGYRPGRALVQVAGLKRMSDGRPDDGLGNWTKLGTRRVSLVTDRDTIRVGGSIGRFRNFRFQVTGEPIHLYDIRITFGNGETQTLDFNEHIPAGSFSRVFDLPGRERVISRIDLVYKKSHRGGQAFLTVYGQA